MQFIHMEFTYSDETKKTLFVSTNVFHELNRNYCARYTMKFADPTKSVYKCVAVKKYTKKYVAVLTVKIFVSFNF